MRSLARLLLLLTLAGWPAAAHDFTITSTALIFDGRGGFQLDVSIDVDALALGMPLDADSAQVAAAMRALTPAELEAAIERARRELDRQVELLFDGRPAALEATFPLYGTPAAAAAEIPTVLGTLARLSGAVPSDASEVSLRFDEAFKTVDLKIFDPAAPGLTQYLLRPGEQSPAHRLQGRPQLLEVSVFGRYLLLGFEHILPKGLDHILFVLGLFLLSARWKPLLLQVSAFTLAHSVTLALSMLGVISLPSKVVEPLIALSIAYVAIENLLTSELKPWRPFVVFGFGLLHGLGFAGVLAQLGTPRESFLLALVGFNVGVEAGQLTVLALAFAAVGWLFSNRLYRRAVVIPASLAIAAVGMYWALERAFL
jgi:hypothetical protein